MVISGSDGVTFPDSTTQNTTDRYGFVNRIINGDMRIDQRNAGASVTANNGIFGVDRFKISATQSSKGTIQQNAGSVTPPVGFKNYLGLTSSSAFSPASSDLIALLHRIEGFNIADLEWGTSSAKTVTLSFWVYSSLTGTFGGGLGNSDGSYTYPFNYTISSANTWEQKTITITGATSGTWTSDNSTGINISWSLATGSNFSGTAGAWTSGVNAYNATGATQPFSTNGATFYITGVQLEVGSVATPFERRPFGAELALCQRYYYKNQAETDNAAFGMAQCETTTSAWGIIYFPVKLRIRPTALEQSGTASNYRVYHSGTTTTCNSVPTYDSSTTSYAGAVYFPVASGLTVGRGAGLIANNVNAYLAWSAEL